MTLIKEVYNWILLDDSLETNILNLRIIATWICYLSFFRGVASFFAGYVVTLIPISITFFILLIPPLIILLPAKYDSPRYILITILLWLGGVLTDYIWFKIIFLMVGTSFSFLALRHDFKYYNLTTLKWLPFIFGIDLLLRSPNIGQDLFVHSNLISKFIVSLIALSSIYLISKNKIVAESIPTNNTKKLNLDQLAFSFTFFMLFAVYLVELAGPGILVMNNFVNQQTAIILSVSTFFVLSYFALKVNNKLTYKHGLLLGIILGVSIYFYPWYDVYIVFWFLGIMSIQLLFQLNLEQFIVIGQSERSRYLLVGHYSIIITMFYGFLTESYLLMPIISFVVGVTFLTKRKSNLKFLKVGINVAGANNKVISGIILLLLLSPLVPLNSTNNALDSTSNIRIMTYNLHFGISGNGEDNGLAVINVIKAVNPTIIAFQEVTFAASINGYKNMYSFLQSELEVLGYKYSYFSEGGKYQTRNAIFSKFRMVEIKTTLLHPRVTYERNLIETRIIVENSELMLYTTHLTHVMEQHSNPDRVTQALQVIDIINPVSQIIPIILLGDFNAEPDWDEIQVITSKLNDTWMEKNSLSDGFTWPNNDPEQRIDYIFHNSFIRVESCSVVDSSASDHLPVVCDFVI
ncbi:MAG: hypothetical protein HeimC2_38570 [Candidatus Heimdallarchaeota archaeon LC_2]|nr:MAG: hypothetical protein HeimC2_38570 [Candidatus Heimdallarchaeota archaeon LC_2]